MARYAFPESPSTPGSTNDGSNTSSPRTPVAEQGGRRSRSNTRSQSRSPVYPDGPTSFKVPSSHGTPSTATDGRGSRSPSRTPPSRTPGVVQRSPPSADTNRFKRSRTPSPETPTQRRRGTNSLAGRNFRPATLRHPRGDAGVRETTPVPRDAEYGGSGVPGSSSSGSSTDGSDPDYRDDEESGDDLPQPPADHSDNDESGDSLLQTPDIYVDPDDQEQWMPLVGHQPERLPGRFGTAQPFPNQYLTLLKERPGRLPGHTARSPTSPGFDWGDGAAWWHPAGSAGKANIVREIFTTTGFKVITHAVANDVANMMHHENLVNMHDGDGFGDDKTRTEVLYEFCQGGTLNKLILSRKPEVPIFKLKPRRPATYLPTREVFLGLPEDLVWHVLLSLLRAADSLHHRRQPVVHCAIDPANVFFTAPHPNDQRPLVRKYGLVKLGNFSKAVILPHKQDPDRNDPEVIDDRCEMFEHMITEPYAETGYEAPEMLGMLGEDEISEEKIFPGPCSDLFSIGVTCFAMMTGKTVWDLLLERRFISRAAAPHRVERAVLEEKWRYAEYEQRMEMLQAILRGDKVVGDALPALYSAELREFVEGLLNLDPDMRGESAALLDEADELFAEKCAEGGGNGLGEMQRAWKAATRLPTEEEELEKAIREHEELMGSAAVREMRRDRLLGPLVP